MKNQKTNEILIIPPDVQTFEDKRSQAKTVALPFVFPDGKNGVLMIARLDRIAWKPSETIVSVTITYKP